MEKKIILSAKNIVKNFRIGETDEEISVLNGISLSIKKGEFISILGVSGSGKSTLLKCISGLSKPTRGEVLIKEKNPYKLSERKLSQLRRDDVSYIFQDYNLIPSLPVLENVTLPCRLSRKKVDYQRVKALLKDLNFNADTKSMISALSGGEQQKIAIARAVLADSQIIFADEPTGALDSVSRQIIISLLRQLVSKGKTIIMVTHDIELATLTDKAYILKNGVIFREFEKPTAKLLYNSLSENTDFLERE